MQQWWYCLVLVAADVAVVALQNNCFADCYWMFSIYFGDKFCLFVLLNCIFCFILGTVAQLCCFWVNYIFHISQRKIVYFFVFKWITLSISGENCSIIVLSELHFSIYIGENCNFLCFRVNCLKLSWVWAPFVHSIFCIFHLCSRSPSNKKQLLLWLHQTQFQLFTLFTCFCLKTNVPHTLCVLIVYLKTCTWKPCNLLCNSLCRWCMFVRVTV